MSPSDNCEDGASKLSTNGVCAVNNKLQNMSTEVGNGVSVISVCANCGKGEEESGKLKNCTACKLVKYCSRECQIAHRPQHKKECRKRAAELHDEELFKQPPPPAEDCPICFLRLPYLNTGWRYYSCCGKIICSGCAYAPVYDNQGNEVDNEKCPFCRTPFSTTDEEANGREKKRIEANDPFAMHNLGCDYRDGTNGYPQDYTKTLELFTRAGKLGYADAYLGIGNAYYYGRGIEVDKKKAAYYYELGAMGGCVAARCNLGNNEKKTGNIGRALKHYMIAVAGGNSKSLERVKWLYSNGHATKDDYTKALQSYQTYLGEIKSRQRDKAAVAAEGYRYY